jgi:hypothetical protein
MYHLLQHSALLHLLSMGFVCFCSVNSECQLKVIKKLNHTKKKPNLMAIKRQKSRFHTFTGNSVSSRFKVFTVTYKSHVFVTGQKNVSSDSEMLKDLADISR